MSDVGRGAANTVLRMDGTGSFHFWGAIGSGVTLGNTAIVDPVNGNDGTGAVGTLSAFLTVQAAVTAVLAHANQRLQIWVLPGNYDEDVVVAPTSAKHIAMFGAGRSVTRIKSLNVQPASAGGALHDFVCRHLSLDNTVGVVSASPLSFSDPGPTYGVGNYSFRDVDIVNGDDNQAAIDASYVNVGGGAQTYRFEDCSADHDGAVTVAAPGADIDFGTFNWKRGDLFGADASALVLSGTAVATMETFLLQVGAADDAATISSTGALSTFIDGRYVVTNGSAAHAINVSSAMNITLLGSHTLSNGLTGTGGFVGTGGTLVRALTTRENGQVPPTSGWVEIITLERNGYVTVRARIVAAGPTAISAHQQLIPVDMAAIAAPASVTLPTIAAVGVGKTVEVKDVTNGAGIVNTLTITPTGGNTIDGFASEVIATAGGSRTLRAESPTNWAVV